MRLPDKESLTERFDQYTDEQLTEVLRSYKDYQEQAVEVAVEIAIKRKLIYNRQDMFSAKFNQSQTSPKKFFPLLSERQSAKMLTVIFRIIYLIAFIPLIFAILSFAERNVLQIILWGIGALAWGGVTMLIEKKQEARLVFLLPALFFCFHLIYFISIRYTFKPGVMDLTVYLMAVLLFFYLIGYLYTLLRRSTNS